MARWVLKLRILAVALAVAGPAWAQDYPEPKVETAPNGEPVVVHEGEASYYGPGFHGKKTASGERFDQNAPTAASRELPLGTKATVTNEENGRQIEVEINDRGPYVEGRIIDLSKGAARQLGMIEDGVAPVRVEVKPSEQPSEKARDKVEAKAEEIIAESQPAATQPEQVAQADEPAPIPDGP